MSSKVIVLWGFLIVALIVSIFVIGTFNKEQIVASYKFDKQVKTAVKKYMVEEKKKPPFTIISSDLIEKEYLDSLTYDNRVCYANIKVKKILFLNKFDINYTCELVDLSANED